MDSELVPLALEHVACSYLDAMQAWLHFGFITRLGSSYKLVAMGVGDVLISVAMLPKPKPKSLKEFQRDRLVICLLFLPTLVLFFESKPLLLAFGQSELISELATKYALALMPAVFFD